MYMNEVYMPKYQRIKSWKVVNKPKVPKLNSQQKGLASEIADDYHLVELKKVKAMKAGKMAKKNLYDDFQKEFEVTKPQQLSQNYIDKLLDNNTMNRFQAIKDEDNTEFRQDGYGKYFVLTCKFHQSQMLNQKHIVYGYTTVQEVIDMVSEGNLALKDKGKINLRYKNAIMQNKEASLRSYGMTRDSFVFVLLM